MCKASLPPKGSRARFDRSLVFLALQGQDFLVICSLHLPTGLPMWGFCKPWHWETAGMGGDRPVKLEKASLLDAPSPAALGRVS